MNRRPRRAAHRRIDVVIDIVEDEETEARDVVARLAGRRGTLYVDGQRFTCAIGRPIFEEALDLDALEEGKVQ
jgi:hypothetical protein